MTLEFSSLDQLIVLRTICEGPHATIKAVKCTESEVIYAAKIYKSGIPESILRNEEAFSGQVSGPNIIRVAAISSSGLYRKKSGREFTCFYILMEFCVNGDLFSFANILSPIPEEILRYLFLQIISAIDTCCTSRVCHRNLKPENIMITADYTLKVSSFSRSSRYETQPSISVPKTSFCAPETSPSSIYYDNSADIFSAGVSLFTICLRGPPFLSTSAIDHYYKNLPAEPEKFWSLHLKNKGIQVSDEFKDLVQAMLHQDPALRISLREIKTHPWVMGPVASVEEIKTHADEKKTAAYLQASLQIDHNKLRIHPMRSCRGYKGASSSSNSSSFEDLKFKTLKGVKYNKFGRIVTGLEPSQLFDKVHEYLGANSAEAQISQKYFQMNAKIDMHLGPLELRFTVYQKKEFYLLDVDMISGYHHDFAIVVGDLTKHIFQEKDN